MGTYGNAIGNTCLEVLIRDGQCQNFPRPRWLSLAIAAALYFISGKPQVAGSNPARGSILPSAHTGKWFVLVLTLSDVLLLAIIQGITEWLPISSSGHLVIVSEVLDVLPDEKGRVVLAVILHLGTLLAVFTVFWRDVTGILSAVVRRDFTSEEGELGVLIVVGTVPIALFGLFLQNFLESFFSSLLSVGVALLITGFILFLSRWRKAEHRLTWLNSLVIGFAQVAAIIPGISRSGITIAAGLLLGVYREKAFKYSFLLSLPTVLGAILLEARYLVAENMNAVFLAIGTLVSMGIGYISLRLLQKLIMKEKLYLFAFYCWLLGFVVLTIQFI